MPTHLHLHPLRTDTAQRCFRSKYELRHADYELFRSMNNKGEVISEVTGGKIRVVLDGFGDEDLFVWLFDPSKRESGEIVTTVNNETVQEKLAFSGAKATGYRLHFDSNVKDSVSAVLTIEASEIATDNGLYCKEK